MDLYKLIQDLYAEKEKLKRVIASIEALQRAAGGDIPPAPVGESRAPQPQRPSVQRPGAVRA
jgi:hypothetical protein